MSKEQRKAKGDLRTSRNKAERVAFHEYLIWYQEQSGEVHGWMCLMPNKERAVAQFTREMGNLTILEIEGPERWQQEYKRKKELPRPLQLADKRLKRNRKK